MEPTLLLDGRSEQMRNSLLHPPSDTVSPQQDVEVALLHDAYARLRQSLLMIVTVSCIFAGFLWPFFPTPLMTIWVIVILSVAGARYLLWKSFQRAQGQALALARWRRLFWAGSAAAGAAWALGPTLMMPEAGSAEPMLFVGTLLSVCAVAISTPGIATSCDAGIYRRSTRSPCYRLAEYRGRR
jgi:nucleoside recognition membrane protein YjiH